MIDYKKKYLKYKMKYLQLNHNNFFSGGSQFYNKELDQKKYFNDIGNDEYKFYDIINILERYQKFQKYIENWLGIENIFALGTYERTLVKKMDNDECKIINEKTKCNNDCAWYNNRCINKNLIMPVRLNTIVTGKNNTEYTVIHEECLYKNIHNKYSRIGFELDLFYKILRDNKTNDYYIGLPIGIRNYEEYSEFNIFVDYVYNIIVRLINSQFPYKIILFGHSMGAKMCLNLGYRLFKSHPDYFKSNILVLTSGCVPTFDETNKDILPLDNIISFGFALNSNTHYYIDDAIEDDNGYDPFPNTIVMCVDNNKYTFHYIMNFLNLVKNENKDLIGNPEFHEWNDNYEIIIPKLFQQSKSDEFNI